MTSEVRLVRAHELYQLATNDPDWTLRQATDQLGEPEGLVRDAVQFLVRTGLFRESADANSGFVCSAPETALNQLVAAELAELDERKHRLASRERSIRFLAREVLEHHLRRRDVIRTEILSGDERIAARLADANALAGQEILNIHRDPVLSTQALAERLRQNRQALDRGVVVRSIHLDALRRNPKAAAQLADMRDMGVRVRLAQTVPFWLTIVDHTMAFTSIPTPNGDAAARVMYGSAITDLLRNVFEHCWLLATPVRPDVGSRPLEQVQRTDQQQSILQMMAAGTKDAAIARELGISARTLRRGVSELMERVGAESRFQLALRARDLGLLDDE